MAPKLFFCLTGRFSLAFLLVIHMLAFAKFVQFILMN